MTKVIILGDTHFGARNSNKVVEKWQGRFFEETFWPYVEENGIKQIIQLGDWFDNRKWINLQTMAFQHNVFVEKSKELNCRVHTIIGNHDIPMKFTLENSSTVQILSQHDNITIWDTPGKFSIDDVEFTMIPWMCRDNYDECLSVVKEGGDICIGHFEIEGFVMHPGAISRDGLHLRDFSKWNKVWSGHYHTQSNNANIHYLGTPYQMNWSDATTKQGFWVFDTVDRSLEFVENNHRYFHRFYWNDGCDVEIKDLNDTYVKVNVQKKTDFEAFETFIDKINFFSPYELKIIESYEEYNQENVQDMIDLSSTEDLIQEYIDEVATTTNKESVKSLMLEIYQEAMSIEE